MVLSLSSIFQDFFESPEDDPLLQDGTVSDEDAPEDASGHASDSTRGRRDERTSTRTTTGGDGVPSDAAESARDTADNADMDVALPEGLSSNLLRHGTSGEASDTDAPAESATDDQKEEAERTKKFVVPYNASAEDLHDVNEAIESGWSFRRISVTKARTSVKPEGRKVIITLELNEPRSLFDF